MSTPTGDGPSWEQRTPGAGALPHGVTAPGGVAYGVTPPGGAAVVHRGRGRLLALLAVPAGVVAWVLLWRVGVLTAFVALLVAALALGLYKRGAGVPPHRADAVFLVAVTVAGMGLAFVSGLVSDLWVVWSQRTGEGMGALANPDFIDHAVTMLGRPAVWSAYGRDLLMTVILTAVGSLSILRFASGAPVSAGPADASPPSAR